MTLGKRVTKISPKDLENIISDLQDKYFLTGFEDNYGTVSDQSSLVQEQQEQKLQQTTISLKLGHRYKSVKFLDKGDEVPSLLKNIVKNIEKITKVDQLSGINLYT